MSSKSLLRIGVFYDGNFFIHVSNYYKYGHRRRSHISIAGFHEFFRHHIATEEGIDPRFCQIVDAHFFRGRFSARFAESKQQLFSDRVFDEILMGEGVVTHYLPIRGGGEKGIDVLLALEAFELAIYKHFDVLILIAGDGDFVPLAKKLNSLGTKVMVPVWNFEYRDDQGEDRYTTTSTHLVDVVSYPVEMDSIIDDPAKSDDELIKGLFVESMTSVSPNHPSVEESQDKPHIVDSQLSTSEEKRYDGEIYELKFGFGFIRSVSFEKDIYFHWKALRNIDFNDLNVGNGVTFSLGENPKGKVAIEIDVIGDDHQIDTLSDPL